MSVVEHATNDLILRRVRCRNQGLGTIVAVQPRSNSVLVRFDAQVDKNGVAHNREHSAWRVLDDQWLELLPETKDENA